MTASEKPARTAVRMARRRLDALCMRMAEADPDGTEIEHVNAEALSAALSLGRALSKERNGE